MSRRDAALIDTWIMYDRRHNDGIARLPLRYRVVALVLMLRVRF